MGKKRILIVDDDPMVRESMEIILRLDGHLLDPVESAAQALARFEPGKYDLVLTDNRMPGITGIELAAQLKAQSPSQPIILFSGSPPVGVASACDLVLVKPFSAATLRQAVVKVTANGVPTASAPPSPEPNG